MNEWKWKKIPSHTQWMKLMFQHLSFLDQITSAVIVATWDNQNGYFFVSLFCLSPSQYTLYKFVPEMILMIMIIMMMMVVVLW